MCFFMKFLFLNFDCWFEKFLYKVEATEKTSGIGNIQVNIMITVLNCSVVVPRIVLCNVTLEANVNGMDTSQ